MISLTNFNNFDVLYLNTRKGSPTPGGHRGSGNAQPILGTQSATTTTHMVLSKLYFKLSLARGINPQLSL